MSKTHTDLTVGRLALPDGWETRFEVSCLEPRRAGLAAPLAGRPAGKAKRANLVISRRPTNQGAVGCLEALLAEMAQTVRGLKVEDRGTAGSSPPDGMPFATVAFEVDGAQILQRYWLRVDCGVATQLTATVARSDAAKLDEALTGLALSFEPPT